MRFSALLTTVATLVGATSASIPSTQLIFTIGASPSIIDPSALPPSTHATLSTLGTHMTAPLSAANTFTFGNVTAGSYLVDVHCASHGFAPVRVDVSDKGAVVGAWETFRGNEWDNKGEVVPGMEKGRFELRVLGQRDFYLERPKFSVLSLLKNPMILMAGVSMVIFMGMPWLMDNLDPELRAEIEERQKSGGILGAAASGNTNPANFDMAAYLSGASSAGGKKKEKAGPVQTGGVRR
ncbi:hypothetical protein TD95_002272 [Thielaviopsis punctulata]|uniref:ER membrane protein complex subunit 7 beta-sandwich domain-containing protein n=1 Tax=Thielaviopsis punctulata TaxID=72032 RepID=A0A0F4ZM26_9PEZI|nr:hypothetical protein TD95_002272 [Thielaviopsis punctulata]